MEKIEQLLTESDVAKILKRSVATLRNDRYTGTLGLPFVQIGGSIRYRPSDVQAWLDGLGTNSSSNK